MRLGRERHAHSLVSVFLRPQAYLISYRRQRSAPFLVLHKDLAAFRLALVVVVIVHAEGGDASAQAEGSRAPQGHWAQRGRLNRVLLWLVTRAAHVREVFRAGGRPCGF